MNFICPRCTWPITITENSHLHRLHTSPADFLRKILCTQVSPTVSQGQRHETTSCEVVSGNINVEVNVGSRLSRRSLLQSDWSIIHYCLIFMMSIVSRLNAWWTEMYLFIESSPVVALFSVIFIEAICAQTFYDRCFWSILRLGDSDIFPKTCVVVFECVCPTRRFSQSVLRLLWEPVSSLSHWPGPCSPTLSLLPCLGSNTEHPSLTKSLLIFQIRS